MKGDRLEALFVMTVALGLREDEVLGLSWDSIDWQKETVRVTAALQRIDGKLQLVDPKTSRSRRTPSMPKLVTAALHAHRCRQLEEKMMAGERWRESGLVFTTGIGTPLDARNVVRRFHAASGKENLAGYRFHDIRHSCASLLLAQHVPARVVMDVLGHSQIRLTLDTYSHVTPAMLQDAAPSIDAALRRKR